MSTPKNDRKIDVEAATHSHTFARQSMFKMKYREMRAKQLGIEIHQTASHISSMKHNFVCGCCGRVFNLRLSSHRIALLRRFVKHKTIFFFSSGGPLPLSSELKALHSSLLCCFFILIHSVLAFLFFLLNLMAENLENQPKAIKKPRKKPKSIR
jgi:hypothetical protein